MERIQRFWRRIPVAVRKPLVFMVGSSVVAAGIAMLVLPGPGWAAIFLGFAILATEFAFAEKVRDWLVDALKKLIKHGQKIARAHPWLLVLCGIVLILIIFLIFKQFYVK